MSNRHRFHGEHRPSPYWRARTLLVSAMLIALSLWLGRPSAAPACGPFFPSSVIYSDASVLAAPTASFDFELSRIALEKPQGFDVQAIPPVDNLAGQSIATEHIELSAALEASKTPAKQSRVIIDEYLDVRRQLQIYKEEVDQFEAESATAGANIAAGPTVPDVSVPNNLPPEFADYLKGMIAFRSGEHEAARRAWMRLLDRPAAERHYRSTWAAFMIGRSHHISDFKAAAQAYAQTRSLAAEGFADSLGLAAASIGWEAQLEYYAANYERAIQLYLLQRATGDSTATPSLRIVCEAALRQNDEVLKRLAADPLSRRVLIAYGVSHGEPSLRVPDPESGMERWRVAVESLNLKEIDGADRLAWIAYRSGNMDATQRWLSRSPADSALARWIESKLLLRAGKLDAAAEVLAKAVRLLPESDVTEDPFARREHDPDRDSVRRAEGQLGAVQLTRGHYVEALDLLLRADYWNDASYVAERILTVSELTTYVNRHWPEMKHPVPADESAEIPADNSPRAEQIRHLLARRLARLGRLQDSRPYFPEKLRPKLDAYATGLREGRDPSRTALDRSAALWHAASIAREFGMELLGTELDPDSFETGGNYGRWNDTKPAQPRGAGQKIMVASADEKKRFLSNVPVPDKRFHYRYIAAGLAWDAADLMPDEEAETARVLCVAGNWIQNRDPKGAKRFYDALVQRCGSTPLGREATRKKWIPAAH